MSSQMCVWLGGMLGAIGVAAGAMGAHALQSVLAERQLGDYEVAVRYQLLHAVALVLCGLLLSAAPSRAAQLAGWCFFLGVLLFSGCLYAWLYTGWRPWSTSCPWAAWPL